MKVARAMPSSWHRLRRFIRSSTPPSAATVISDTVQKASSKAAADRPTDSSQSMATAHSTTPTRTSRTRRSRAAKSPRGSETRRTSFRAAFLSLLAMRSLKSMSSASKLWWDASKPGRSSMRLTVTSTRPRGLGSFSLGSPSLASPLSFSNSLAWPFSSASKSSLASPPASKPASGMGGKDCDGSSSWPPRSPSATFFLLLFSQQQQRPRHRFLATLRSILWVRAPAM
mmetsp:Transcript_56617/g.128358  ORF Transcript_56617/g.128358 Transcript_56617/m.128358 type:complete len:228 (-) Transcript_56617:150-833(-)